MSAPNPGVVAEHERRREHHDAEAKRQEAQATRLSVARLVAFLAMAVFVATGFSQNYPGTMLGGLGLFGVFAALVVWHGRILGRRDEAVARRAVHERHLIRSGGPALELRPSGQDAFPDGHCYASDIDLVGEGSLMQRIDVSHTVRGEALLAEWLGAPASLEVIEARQGAVAELAGNLDFRESLEALGTKVQGEQRLDPAPFLSFVGRKPLVRGAIAVATAVLPVALVATTVAYAAGAIPRTVPVILLGLQSAFALVMALRVIDAFQLVAARRGYVEALRGMLVAIEEQRFEAPLLQELAKRVHVGGLGPANYMRRLDRWAGFAEFYTQFPVSFFVNLATLYDLHVLWQLERWNAEVGQGLEDVFEALAEMEALASLGTLKAIEESVFPELSEGPRAVEVDALRHPLLPKEQRVANDVKFPDAGSVLIVTGSNMAGKSTLLRAMGLNLALAYAGGPVLADRFAAPRMRLRASMRVDDSLQKGASYFHAELSKLRGVVEGSEAKPPVFFLLDELLRGTNARARHIGARAVLEHLLKRGASGLAATHDIALAALEEEYPGKVANVHFTDVMHGDEMTFDYTLRDGVVKTSNALRLLQLAGVEVEVDEALPEAQAIFH